MRCATILPRLPIIPIIWAFDLEALVTLKTDQSRAEGDIVRLEQELTDLGAQRAALVLSPALVALSQELDLLDPFARARCVRRPLDLPRRRDQLAQTEAAMAQAARDLGAPTGCDPALLVPTQAQLAGLEDARDGCAKRAPRCKPKHRNWPS